MNESSYAGREDFMRLLGENKVSTGGAESDRSERLAVPQDWAA